MSDGKRYYIIAIAAFSLLITFLHFLVPEQRAVLEELYYIPLLFGALMFGIKGAIFIYLIVSAAYVPFLLKKDRRHRPRNGDSKEDH